MAVEIPAKVAADTAYQNAMKNSDCQNARIEMDTALLRVMISLMKDETQLFKQFSDDEGFKRWLSDTVFGQTYQQGGGSTHRLIPLRTITSNHRTWRVRVGNQAKTHQQALASTHFWNITSRAPMPATSGTNISAVNWQKGLRASE